jgi:hypothetical protein
VQIHCYLGKDKNAARDRLAAHPEDRGANIVIFEFYDDEGTVGGARLSLNARAAYLDADPSPFESTHFQVHANDWDPIRAEH